MNYVFLICIKKQYTSFLQSNLTRVVKTDFVTCDHQYCDFYKTHEHSLVTWAIAHFA